MILNIKNETSTLKAVVMGQPGSIGQVPSFEQTYDAKSYETVKNGTYPDEESILLEMTAFEKVLLRYNVKVLHPLLIENCNQVFARDIAFVIDDKIIKSNIIPNRENEKEAYELIYKQISSDKIFNLPEKVHMEGGDVVLYNKFIFLGLYSDKDYSRLKTARTNVYALHFLKDLFPEKEIIPVELKKHDTDPGKCILHLDCAFMPVGINKAIINKDGFRFEKDYKIILDIFGSNNVFEITSRESYFMFANVFSVSKNVVVSEKGFTRLNDHMKNKWGLTVEEVPYFEISKMGGLLRCSTLPLVREND